VTKGGKCVTAPRYVRFGGSDPAALREAEMLVLHQELQVMACRYLWTFRPEPFQLMRFLGLREERSIFLLRKVRT
jgi:hypothetical protein